MKLKYLFDAIEILVEALYMLLCCVPVLVLVYLVGLAFGLGLFTSYLIIIR